MLTRTSISALRILTFLGLRGDGPPISPRQMAHALDESPTYLAKVSRNLVRAGILRAHRGVAGGVTLGPTPGQISLLAVVQACQGTILADFCEDAPDLAKTCAFHHAAAELHQAIVGVLARWTVADVVAKPQAHPTLRKRGNCWLEPCQTASGATKKKRAVRQPKQQAIRAAKSARNSR